MEKEILFKILTLVDSVKSNRWRDVLKIVNLMPSIQVKEKKWNDRYKEERPDLYPLDLSKVETWSTYDSCVDLVFSNKENKLCCEAFIFDGDNTFGHRTILRFTATLIMPDEFTSELEKDILYALDSLAYEAYEQFLLSEKELWIANFKAKVLEK